MQERSPLSGAPEPARVAAEVQAALSRTLRIVILDDAPVDAELAERELRKAGLRFVSRRCDSRESLERSLEDFDPDVIISDFGMPLAERRTL